MTEALASGSFVFKPRARLLKLIGGELVSDEIVAVTELVKNAYDADAKSVTIEFRNVREEGGEIVIRDDGHGMDLDVIRDYWMQPGGTTKAGDKNRRSPRGRRVLGEKGIGRFATDKLGTQLHLISRPKSADTEIHANFDWDEFDTDSRVLSEIRNPWQQHTPSVIPGHGTVLHIKNLRTRWTERLFRKLCTRLTRLKSPFESAADFRIVIESQDFPDYSGELAQDFLKLAPYLIECVFDGDQTIAVSSGDVPQALVWNGSGTLDCGPVKMRVYGFDLDTLAIAKVGPTREVRAWLKEWTGISVYRDGFRVWPYGEPNNDWLRLDSRRVNNPVMRMSNNQVIGFVEIAREKNPLLVDQTNREGIIENKAFDDLRRLALFVIQQLEDRRHKVRHEDSAKPGRTGKSVSNQDSSRAEEVERIAATLTGRPSIYLRAIAKRLRETAIRDSERFRAFADGYAELAAVGQAATAVEAYVRPSLEKITKLLSDADAQTANGETKPAKKALASARDEISTINTWMAMMAPLEAENGRRHGSVDITQALQEVEGLIQPVIQAHNIKLAMIVPPGLVRAEIGFQNLLRVIHILLTNSIEWLSSVERPNVQIDVRTHPNHCEIIFSDNGPGIPPEIAERIFEPLYTGREGGRGMGLAIARNIISSCSGSIEALSDRRRKGAHISIVLPRKRARSVRAADRGMAV